MKSGTAQKISNLVLSSAAGLSCPAAKGSDVGASVFHPRGSPGSNCAPPFHGTSVEALRPACPSWIATGMSDQRRTLSSVPRLHS